MTKHPFPAAPTRLWAVEHPYAHLARCLYPVTPPQVTLVERSFRGHWLTEHYWPDRGDEAYEQTDYAADESVLFQVDMYRPTQHELWALTKACCYARRRIFHRQYAAALPRLLAPCRPVFTAHILAAYAAHPRLQPPRMNF